MVSDTSRTGSQRTRRRSLDKAATFAVSGATVITYALLDGSYDLVVRQEISLLIWWIVGLGLLTKLLVPWRHGGWVTATVTALGGVAVWTFVSLAWTESDERTVAEVARVVGYLGLLVLVLLAVRPRTSRSAIRGATAGAVVVCAVALADRLTGSTLSSDAVVSQIGTARLSYPLNYWNAMGTWAAMTVALAVAASVHERRALLRAVALGAVPVAAATAYLAYSRASIASVALGLLIVVFGSRRRWTAFAHVLAAGAASTVVILAIRHETSIATGSGTGGAAEVTAVLVVAVLAVAAVAYVLSRTRLDGFRLKPRIGRVIIAAAAGLLTLTVIALVVTQWSRIERQFNNPTIATRADDPASRLTTLNGTRRVIWDSALDAFAAHPSTGVGAGAFELWWNRAGKSPEFVRDAHSLYLESLAELGWPGGLLILAFAGSLLAMVLVSRLRAPPSNRETGTRLAGLAAVSILLLSSAVDWMWESTAVTALALIVAGSSSVGLIRARSPVGLPFRGGLAVAALFACLVELPGMVSTSDVRSSQAAMRRGDVNHALAAARDARAAAPWASSPVVQLALIAEATRHYGAAQVLLRDAAERDPFDFRVAVLAARVAAENGDLRTARAEYEQARRLRPRSQLFPQPSVVSGTPAAPRKGP